MLDRLCWLRQQQVKRFIFTPSVGCEWIPGYRSRWGPWKRPLFSTYLLYSPSIVSGWMSLATRFRCGAWKRLLFSTYLLYSPSIVCEWIPGYPLQMGSVEETAILNLSSILSLYCVWMDPWVPASDGERGRDRYSQLIFCTLPLLCVNGSLGTRFRWGAWKRPLFSTYLLYSPSIVCEWIPGYPLQMGSVEETAILNLSSLLSLYCVWMDPWVPASDGERGRHRYSQLIFSTLPLLCVNGSLGTRFRWGAWKRPLFSTYLLYSPSIVCEWIPGYPLQMGTVEETAILNLSSLLSQEERRVAVGTGVRLDTHRNKGDVLPVVAINLGWLGTKLRAWLVCQKDLRPLSSGRATSVTPPTRSLFFQICYTDSLQKCI